MKTNSNFVGKSFRLGLRPSAMEMGPTWLFSICLFWSLNGANTKPPNEITKTHYSIEQNIISCNTPQIEDTFVDPHLHLLSYHTPNNEFTTPRSYELSINLTSQNGCAYDHHYHIAKRHSGLSPCVLAHFFLGH